MVNLWIEQKYLKDQSGITLTDRDAFSSATTEIFTALPSVTVPSSAERYNQNAQYRIIKLQFNSIDTGKIKDGQ